MANRKKIAAVTFFSSDKVEEQCQEMVLSQLRGNASDLRGLGLDDNVETE